MSRGGKGSGWTSIARKQQTMATAAWAEASDTMGLAAFFNERQHEAGKEEKEEEREKGCV